MMAKLQKKFSSVVLERVIRVIAVLSLVLATFGIVDNTRKTNCQAAYNEANNQRTAALSAVTNSERASSQKADDAMREFVTALVDPAKNQNKEYIAGLFKNIQVAYNQQYEDRARAEKARAENPVLPPPSTRC